MAVTPTGRSQLAAMNVGFTPTSGSLLTITGVKSVGRASGAKLVSAAADGDLIDSIVVVNELAPEVTIELNKPFMLDAVADGTEGTLVWTVPDAKNGITASGGAITYTLIHAVYMSGDQKTQHRDWGSKTLTFKGYAPDGLTNPVSFAAV